MKTPSFIHEEYALPGHKPRPINLFTTRQLLRAYKLILSDPESAGVYEPVAYGIRELWYRRRRDVNILHRIDRNFKNLRRNT
jgi:hypothetical protein